MIKIIVVFFLIAMLLAFVHKAVSTATLREYKLAFKIGALATASCLTMFLIANFF